MSLRNRFVLPFVLSILAVLAGCGSSTPSATPPPGGGYTNSNLSGTYVISTSGVDPFGAQFSMAGTITANGSGGITGGTLDINDSDTSNVTSAFQSFGQPITSGNYSITVDGRGRASVATTLGTFGFAFVLSSNQHGLVSEFDGNGTGSGTIDLQTTVSQSQLTSYAFTMGGSDQTDNLIPLIAAGAFTLDGSGNITTGVEDFSDNGNVYLSQGLSGTMVLGSGGGSGTAVLSSLFGALNFDFFVVDATHVKFIETDPLLAPVLAGDAFQQAAMPSGPLVFAMSGENTGGPLVAGGFMTAGGANQSNNGTFDDDVEGTVSPGSVPFTFSYAPVSAGRTTISLTNFGAGLTQLAAYPTTGGLLMIDTDAGSVVFGTAFNQTSTALAVPPQGYGLNFSGSNANGEIDDVAEFVTGSSGTMTGLLDENDQGTPEPVQSITNNSTFQQDSPVTGRGEAQFNSSSTNTLFDIVFYTVDGTNTIFIENDTFQIAVGSFQQQSGTTASSMATARPLIIPRVPVMRGALKHAHMPAK